MKRRQYITPNRSEKGNSSELGPQQFIRICELYLFSFTQCHFDKYVEYQHESDWMNHKTFFVVSLKAVV